VSDLTNGKIEAAITRLEKLRGNTYSGAWTSTNDDWWWLEGVNHRVVYRQGRAEIAFTHDGEADLIVTLHATIDAQLAILYQFAEYPNVHLEEAVIGLADAITGGTE
jgi:hypothetical protein